MTQHEPYPYESWTFNEAYDWLHRWWNPSITTVSSIELLRADTINLQVEAYGYQKVDMTEVLEYLAHRLGVGDAVDAADGLDQLLAMTSWNLTAA